MVRLLDRVYVTFEFSESLAGAKKIHSSFSELEERHGTFSNILSFLNSHEGVVALHTDRVSFAWVVLQYYKELYPTLPNSELERLYIAATDQLSVIAPTFLPADERVKFCRVPVDASAVKYQGGFSDDLKRELPLEAFYGDFLNGSRKFEAEFKEKIKQYTVIECNNYLSNLRDVVFQRAQKFSDLFPEAPIQPSDDVSVLDCFNQPFFAVIQDEDYPKRNVWIEERDFNAVEARLKGLFSRHSIDELVRFGVARFNWNFKNKEMQTISVMLKSVLREKLSKMYGAVRSGDYLHYLTEGGVYALIDNSTVDEVIFLMTHNVLVIERLTNLKKSGDPLLKGYALE